VVKVRAPPAVLHLDVVSTPVVVVRAVKRLVDVADEVDQELERLETRRFASPRIDESCTRDAALASVRRDY
jgi:hypothetical protein